MCVRPLIAVVFGIVLAAPSIAFAQNDVADAGSDRITDPGQRIPIDFAASA